MAKYQHLNNDGAGVIPAPAKMVEAEIAVNTTDLKIFTKNKAGQVAQIGYSQAELDKKFSDSAADAGKKFLATENRLSELSSGNLSLVKTTNDNIGSAIAKPITLDQAKGTGANITRMDDARLTEMNQTWTINATMEDGPAGVAVSSAILINTRRAFAAGASIYQKLINAGGITYIRTGTGSAGNFTWNGVTQGQKDPNGWRKVFDSVVLPSVVELGAAKSGVNSDITALNNLNTINGTTAFNGDINVGSGNIVQSGAARSIQSNYRFGVARAGGLPYMTFTDTTLSGTKFPDSNGGVMSLQGKTAPVDGNFDSGRQLVSVNGYFLPTGGGYLQLRANDVSPDNPNAAVQVASVELYGSQSGSIAGGTVYVRAPLLKAQNRFEVGTTNNIDTNQGMLNVFSNDGAGVGNGNSFVAFNSGTSSAPVYNHYFRGKGQTFIDTLGGLAVRSNINISGAGSSNMSIGSGASDVFISNSLSGKVLQLKDNGILAYSDQPIYHAGNKPTAQDVGGLSLTGGGTVSGQTAFSNALYVNSDYGVTFNVGTVQNRILAPLDGIIRVNTQGRLFADFDGRLVKGAGSLKIEGSTWAKNNPKGYAEQYGIPGVVDVNFSDTAEGYLPAFKARSTVTGRGYNTQASIGLLREGGNAWGKMALFVASDEGGTSAHPRAVATLDTSGNFNSNILSTNYLTVNGAIDTVNAITSQQNINALGSVNARAGITNNGTLYMASNTRRHIQFANGDISKTDGYIFKDWAGPMQILASDGGSVSSTYSFHPSGYFEAAKIRSGGQIETGSGQATFSASGDSYGPTWNNGWLSSLLASHGISDKTVKTNIKDATRDPMEVIDKIRFVEFDWTEDMMKYKNSETVKNGFISQELNEIDPSLVQESLGKLQLDTSSIIPLSLNAIQQLNKRVKELEAKLDELTPSIPESETVEIKTVKKRKAK